MTICRKCGKEIQDGEELCEDCKNEESTSGENYLDELMQSMETDDIGEPAASERIMAMKKERELEEANRQQEAEAEPMPEPEPMPEEEPMPELEAEPMPELEAEPMPELEAEAEPEAEISDILDFEPDFGAEEMSELIPEEETEAEPEPMPEEEPMLEFEAEAEPEPEPEEESMPEPEAEAEPEPEEEPAFEAAEEAEPSDDINELLNLLSKDYESEDEDFESEDYEEEDILAALNDVENSEQPAAEASLFSEDESGSIFADSPEAVGVDDIFQDALSAVDYSEKEEENGGDDFMALDSFDSPEKGEKEETSDGQNIGVESIPVTEPARVKPKKVKAPKADGKVSFWKRVFGNVVTEQTAVEEAKEREQEEAAEQEKAAEREEKKKQAAETKEEKAAAKAAEKERKAAEKAERATAKAAEKEEKKRVKLEMEANEVVGKINPVGAAIVMVFFGLICISVILGTQMLSYSSAVKNAESNFESGDYRAAYKSIAGVDVSESSQEMADKVRICMQVQKELDSYTNYYKMKMYLEALDSLMKGIRSYDLNRQKADDYGIINEYNALESKVAEALNSEFDVSETQARSINSTEDLAEYTAKLEEIIRRWEAKNREDER